MKEVDNVLILEAITSTIANINVYNEELFDNFYIQQQKDDINLEIGIATANNSGKNRVYLPMQDTDRGLSTNKPGQSFNMEGSRISLDGRADELDELLADIVYEKKGTTAARTAKVFKDQLKLAGSEDYILCLKENPIHSNVYNSLMTTFPTPFYQSGIDPETQQPIYERDDEKYEQMMEKYGFIKLLEDNQKFMMEETLPYVQAKKNGTITPQQAQEYKEKYVAHLQNMKESSKKISQIDFNDPLVAGNKAVVTNANIEMRWHNEFDNVTSKITTMQNNMGNGWPTRDYGILMEIMKWHDKLKKTINDREASKEEKAKANNILSDVQESYDALFTTKIDSMDVRNNLLGNIKSVANKYEGDTVLTAMIEDTLAANVKKAEIGIVTTRKNVEYNDFVVVNDAYSINKTSISIDDNLTELKESPKERTSQVKVPEKKAVGVASFDKVEMKKQVDELYKSIKDVDYFMFGKSSDEFNDMMRAVTDMKKYVDDMANRKKVKLETLATFGDLVATTRDKVSLYLEKKDRDFQNDTTRRDSEKKQSREQNRIQSALDAFDKLTDIMDYTKNSIEDEILPKHREDIKSKLAKEETIREKEDITKHDYIGSVTRSFYLIGFENGKAVRVGKQDNETFKEYVEKMEKFKIPDLNDKKTVELYNGSKLLRDLVKKVAVNNELPKDENGKTIPYSTAELRYHYNQAIKATASRNASASIANEYRNKLVSRQRREKMAAQNKGPKR